MSRPAGRIHWATVIFVLTFIDSSAPPWVKPSAVVGSRAMYINERKPQFVTAVSLLTESFAKWSQSHEYVPTGLLQPYNTTKLGKPRKDLKQERFGCFPRCTISLCYLRRATQHRLCFHSYIRSPDAIYPSPLCATHHCFVHVSVLGCLSSSFTTL